MFSELLTRCNCAPIAVAIALLATSDPECLAKDLEEVLESHARSIADLSQLHLIVDYSEDVRTAQGKSLGSQEVHEIWRNGRIEREVVTIKSRFGPDGEVQQIPKDFQTLARSFGDREIRNLSGRSFKDGGAAPLDPGRDQKLFEAVRCSIVPRDPAAPTSPVWMWMLLQPSVGLSLADVAKVSSLRLTNVSEGVASIHIDTSEAEHLAGAVIELDLNHGSLIRRLLSKPGIDAVVEDFTSVNGRWLPKSIVRSFDGFRSHVIVNPVEVGEPYSSEFLEVDFPEGARVDEPSRQVIHIWGKGKPAHSFESFDAFVEYVTDRIASAPRPNATGIDESNDRPATTNWLLLLNIGTLIVVVGLLLLRSRLRGK